MASDTQIDFSIAERKWLSTGIFYSVKIFVGNEKEIKTFSDKQNREFVIRRPAVQEILRRVFKVEIKGH